MCRKLVAGLLSASLTAAASIAFSEAEAASIYTVDGIALGASFESRRGYQCSASEQFPQHTWCERKRHERARRGAFDSITSVLQDGSVAYVGREIRPAFFADDEMATEIKRLSTRFGSPAREMHLPERDDISDAVIAVWGKVTLEELDRSSRSALEHASVSPQELLIDYLGDVRRSLKVGLPIYRLRGGAGYVWSAAADSEGRGHLRFLAVDRDALSGAKEAPAQAAPQDAPAEGAKKRAATTTAADATGTIPKVANTAGRPNTAALAPSTGDLRPFLAPQPASSRPDASQEGKERSKEADKQPVSTLPDRQQTVIRKTRADAERARIVEAEQLAADERAKARVAWARFEAEKAAHEITVRWMLTASLVVLLATLALLRFLARPEDIFKLREAARALARPIRLLTPALRPICARGRNLLELGRVCLAKLIMKAHSAVAPKPIEATEQTG